MDVPAFRAGLTITACPANWLRAVRESVDAIFLKIFTEVAGELSIKAVLLAWP